MSGVLTSNDRSAFDLFKELSSGDHRLMYSDGGFHGFVCVLGGSWTWTVWDGDGRVIDGFRSWKMDAFHACAKAIECIERAKAEMKLVGDPKEDGTGQLCHALYGRKAEPRDYLGGSESRMLQDAARVIEASRKVVRLYEATDRLVDQKMLAEARAGLEGGDVGREPPGA
jgi:hypothetical protein